MTACETKPIRWSREVRDLLIILAQRNDPKVKVWARRISDEKEYKCLICNSICLSYQIFDHGLDHVSRSNLIWLL